MISDEQLDAYRISGEKVRVIRDALESNDVKGIVLAWDDSQVMVRRPNKRVVKLDRNYVFQPFSEPRQGLEEL
jgi:Glu-tRNA(Gln) amidotransferase subunit E-like FAD-binding protein